MSAVPIIELLQRYPQLSECELDLRRASDMLFACAAKGRTIFTCGNGGSAADSEHIVGELMKSFKMSRPVDDSFVEKYRCANGEEPPEYLEGAIPAVSLVSQTALMTAFANDQSAEGAFAQQVYAYCKEGDVLIALSTSGNSANVVAAAKVARAKAARVVALTGQKESKLARLADVAICVPESETYKVQELHLPVYHYLCMEIERRVFGVAASASEQKREAIVLAGGFGTRLAGVVADVPKPMALVANRPFLRFLMDYLSENDFEHVVIADGYMREKIEDYFGSSYRCLRIDYSSEDEPLGTGGAIKQALQLCENDRVFILNGDTFFDVDFNAMERMAARGYTGVMAAKRMRDFNRYGTVQIADDGTIIGFHEKQPCVEGLINGGVYLLRKNSIATEDRCFSFETAWLPQIATIGELAAVECSSDFIDIGVPDDYERAQDLLACRIRKWKLAIFDRDGTINVDTGHLHDPNDLALIETTVDSMAEYCGRDDWKIVVVTNQAGIAKGLYTEDDMRAVHKRLDKILASRGVRVDAYYFCPHHPSFTGECDCRKPAPGMLLRAIKEFDANPNDCIMYGNDEKDMKAAYAAGVRGVLV